MKLRSPFSSSSSKSKSRQSATEKKLQKELDAARARITAFETENAKLAADRKELIRRIQVIKTKVSAKIREVQAGVQKRLESSDASRETKTGIASYMKAGFGAALGVIAALAVVNLAVGAIAAISDDGDSGNSGNSENSGNDDLPSENLDEDEGVSEDFDDGGGDVGAFQGFEGGGIVASAAKKKKKVTGKKKNIASPSSSQKNKNKNKNKKKSSPSKATRRN